MVAGAQTVCSCVFFLVRLSCLTLLSPGAQSGKASSSRHGSVRGLACCCCLPLLNAAPGRHTAVDQLWSNVGLRVVQPRHAGTALAENCFALPPTTAALNGTEAPPPFFCSHLRLTSLQTGMPVLHMVHEPHLVVPNHRCNSLAQLCYHLRIGCRPRRHTRRRSLCRSAAAAAAAAAACPAAAGRQRRAGLVALNGAALVAASVPQPHFGICPVQPHIAAGPEANS